MNRRTMLNRLSITAVATLAGCANLGKMSEKGNPRKVVSIQSTDANPSEYTTAVNAELERNTITPDHTALLRVTITNEGSEPLRIGDGHNPVYSGVVGIERKSSTATLLLISPQEDVPKDPRCWKPATSHSVPSVLRFETVAPEESKSITYEILGQPDAEPSECLPVGNYRFETTYHLKRDTDEQQFPWGFDVAIEPEDTESEA